MTQPMQTKDGGKHDAEDPKITTVKQSSLEQELAAAELAAAELSAKMAEQAPQDRVGDDSVSFLEQNGHEEAPEGDDRESSMPHDFVQVQVPPSAQVTDDRKNADTTYDQQIFDAVEKGAAGKLDKLLSRVEGSPDCRDRQGRTPLMLAVEAGNAALVGVFARHGADVNAVDTDGETAVMKAAYGDHLDVLELLVSKGAAPDIRNNEGFSALEIAQEMGHEDLVAFLSAQSHGSTSSIETETSTDSDRDSTADALYGMATSSDFRDQIAPETRGQYQEETAEALTTDPESQSLAVEAAGQAPTEILDTHGAVLEKNTETTPTLQPNAPATNEKRIEFDALDNKQVRSINEKVIEVLDKASKEVGDYVIDTVFNGSYMAVLKPRSQENKRWRKLKKHPEWVIDPRKLTEMTGACAVRRYCLAEGIDISSFSLSHFIELYYVKDLKLILTLAEKARANNYTVRQLKLAIEELREHKDDHDPGKEIIKTLDQPVPLLDDPDLAELCKDKDRVLEELSRAERKKIRSLIKERKPGLDEWKSLMDTFEEILSDLEGE
jgi:ankyrin repeat protein